MTIISSKPGPPLPVTVANGGTGVSTLGDAGVLIGNGTAAVQVTGAGTSGQVLTSNGAGVDPTFQAASAGAVARTGGNSTETTTTSTTEVALISLTVSPAQGNPIHISASIRKSAGAVGSATVFPLANGSYLTSPTSIVWSSTTNQAERGAYILDMGSGVVNYVTRAGVGYIGRDGAGAENQFFVDNALDLSSITSVGFDGLVGDGAITLGIDELQLYTWAIA